MHDAGIGEKTVYGQALFNKADSADLYLIHFNHVKDNEFNY